MNTDQSFKDLEIQKSKILFTLFTIFVSIVSCALYYHVFVSKAFVEVEIEVTKKSDIKIYFAKPGQHYSEKRMSVARTEPGKEKYSFFLADIGKFSKLRLDTHSYEGEAIVKGLTIQQEGYETITIDSPDDFKQLQPLTQIADSTAGSDGLRVLSSGSDPNFELFVVPQYLGLDWTWLAFRYAVICGIVVLVLRASRVLVVELRFVPVLLFGIWMLIVTMAGISKENAHPDEYVHLSATNYYSDNWLPPEISDPAIDNTFSVYGISRLNNGEVYYLFAGKFNKLLESFKLSNYLGLRIFNVFLFGCIFFYSLKNVTVRLVALPLLISPQIWYIFSYCSSDAFALFIAFVAAWQFADSKSLLNSYLRGDGWLSRIAGVVLLGILFGVLFLLKKNYYPFIALLYLCLAVKIFFTEEFYLERRGVIVRLLVITLLGVAIFSARAGVDYIVNGPDRQAKIETMQEQKALSIYKPSTPLEEKHPFLLRKARGTTWQEIVHGDRWGEICFESSFGVFGYFTISGSLIYYDLVRWTGICLLVFVVGSIMLRGGVVGGGTALSVVGLSLALICASFYHSWTVDFQPQGRYLFPILPMFGILCGWHHRVVHRPILILLVSVMFLLSSYFFVFHGLLRISKPLL